jgi:predicted dehydrogenase
MKSRIGFLSVAHLHAGSYASILARHPQAEIAGIWDHNPERGRSFAERFHAPFFSDVSSLLEVSDGVIITAENRRHASCVRWASEAGKPILCEKPLVTREEEAEEMFQALRSSGVPLMTAFPCRYSPAYQRLKAKVQEGSLGRVLAISATNHGMCPFDWFVVLEESGGGAMMDHVVHVVDLMRDFLQQEPVEVYAETSNKIFGKEWEDVALLHVRFEGGLFASIDSSWSRPSYYKIWGDVKMDVVCEGGVLEMNMFQQGFDWYTPQVPSCRLVSYGSNLDAGLIDDFVKVVAGEAEPPITAWDGLQSARVAIYAYESARRSEPVSVPRHLPAS